MVKTIIEDHCKEKIDNFVLKYDAMKKVVTYRVRWDKPSDPPSPKFILEDDGYYWRTFYFDDSKDICGMAEKATKQYAKDKAVDLALVHYRDGGKNIWVDSYMNDNGEKVHTKTVIK